MWSKEMMDMTQVQVLNGALEPQEIQAYIDRAQKNYGRLPKAMTVTVDGDYVDLDYTFEGQPFERIRRITGYLVGTLNRFNDAKRAEERDRVKHSLA